LAAFAAHGIEDDQIYDRRGFIYLLKNFVKSIINKKHTTKLDKNHIEAEKILNHRRPSAFSDN